MWFSHCTEILNCNTITLSFGLRSCLIDLIPSQSHKDTPTTFYFISSIVLPFPFMSLTSAIHSLVGNLEFQFYFSQYYKLVFSIPLTNQAVCSPLICNVISTIYQLLILVCFWALLFVVCKVLIFYKNVFVDYLNVW